MRSYSLIAAYCCVDLKPRSITSVGSLWTYRDAGPLLPSVGSRAVESDKLGWDTEEGIEALRWRCDESGGAAACFARYEVKMASAAASVGSSFTTFAAGVAVLDLERRVDAFPNEPVSGTALLDRELVAPSVLYKSATSSIEGETEALPREEHGIGSLYAVFANVEFFVRNIVED
jgi:hypothetical protein